MAGGTIARTRRPLACAAIRIGRRQASAVRCRTEQSNRETTTMQRRSFLAKATAGARRRRHAGRPGTGPDPAQRPLAAGIQLPEKPRHHLRRRRSAVQVGIGHDRRQVPDQRPRRRRDRSRAAGARCGPGQHRRMRPHRPLLLLRQGSDLGAGVRRSVRAQHPPAQCLVVSRRRRGAVQRVLAGSTASPP